jgi:hypothetical protein
MCYSKQCAAALQLLPAACGATATGRTLHMHSIILASSLVVVYICMSCPAVVVAHSRTTSFRLPANTASLLLSIRCDSVSDAAMFVLYEFSVLRQECM